MEVNTCPSMYACGKKEKNPEILLGQNTRHRNHSFAASSRSGAEPVKIRLMPGPSLTHNYGPSRLFVQVKYRTPSGVPFRK